MALHFGALPTELDPEQVKDYLFELQQRSISPSQSYFKHTVYRLRFLLKTENLPYDYLHLPSIPKEKKLPVILSRDEIWRMLQHADLLKHRILIGLIYGCGLRCMEVRNIELKHLDFDRKLLHIVQSKGKKDRYVPLSDHLIRGIKKYLSIEHPTTFLFTGNTKDAKRFVRIRHYGIISSSWKRGKLQQLQKELKIVRPKIEPKTQHKKCYCCKVGNLITLHVFGQRGPPKAYLIENTLAYVN